MFTTVLDYIGKKVIDAEHNTRTQENLLTLVARIRDSSSCYDTEPPCQGMTECHTDRRRLCHGATRCLGTLAEKGVAL